MIVLVRILFAKNGKNRDESVDMIIPSFAAGWLGRTSGPASMAICKERRCAGIFYSRDGTEARRAAMRPAVRQTS